jgi:hypothetical protein
MRTSTIIDAPMLHLQAPSASPVELPWGHGGRPAHFLAGSDEALQMFVRDREIGLTSASMRIRRVALRIRQSTVPTALLRCSPKVCLERV